MKEYPGLLPYGVNKLIENEDLEPLVCHFEPKGIVKFMCKAMLHTFGQYCLAMIAIQVYRIPTQLIIGQNEKIPDYTTWWLLVPCILLINGLWLTIAFSLDWI